MRRAAKVRPPGPTFDDVRLLVAQKIRSRRDELGLTVEEAAHGGGIHWRHWQKLEAAEMNATLRTLVRVAAALDLGMSELFLHPTLR